MQVVLALVAMVILGFVVMGIKDGFQKAVNEMPVTKEINQKNEGPSDQWANGADMGAQGRTVVDAVVKGVHGKFSLTSDGPKLLKDGASVCTGQGAHQFPGKRVKTNTDTTVW